MTHSTLKQLEHHDEFIARHIGPGDADIAAMLAVVGADSLDDLMTRIAPASILQQGPLGLPAAISERDALAEMRRIAANNKVLTSCIGQGYYGTLTPGVILRNILENPAWYTAYTPYQPEISQGRLEALLNYQTMVCDLTGMEISNASLLDEATAAAEAMTLAKRSARAKSDTIIVAGDCHPQTIAVLKTRAEPLGIKVLVGPAPALMENNDYFAVLAQYPATTGMIHDMRPFVDAAHAKGAIFICAADLLALTLLAPPGEWGCDIVIGSAQRFGVPMGFGGPHAAFMACKDALKRNMPGRLVGISQDAMGNAALRLALQTREQHIRREKATSNVCTAQALLAVMASMYAVFHGPDGLRALAPLAGQAGAGGLRLIELRRAAGGDGADGHALVLREAPIQYDAEDFSAGLTGAKSHVVLGGLERIGFSYFGPPRRGEAPVWQDTWTNPEQMPLLVRVHLSSRDAGWSEMLVAPMIGGTGCRWDSFHKVCR